MYLGISQETKLTDGVYTHGSAGYRIAATDAPSQHRGGVAVFYRPSLHYAVDSVHSFGTNVVGFKLAPWGGQRYIIGCYLAPNDTLTIEIVVTALKERPQGV